MTETRFDSVGLDKDGYFMVTGTEDFGDYGLLTSFSNAKIIGDIYENPELLKNEK